MAKYESPVSFASEFEGWRKRGADAELTAILAPLLARPVGDPGYIAAAKLLGEHPSVIAPDPEEANEALIAARQARHLVKQHGEQVDEALVKRYAPNTSALESELDARYGGKPSAAEQGKGKTELAGVRNAAPRSSVHLAEETGYGQSQIIDW